MKILVTGANGLLGQKLVALLQSKGVALVATSVGPSRILLPDITYHQLDISDQKQVESLIEKIRPTNIINAAAMTNVDQCESDRQKCWQINVSGVAHLCQAAADYGAHLLHLSTDFIFDGAEGPYSEEDQPNPVNYYGRSKLAAERLIQESELKWSIARTILVYGATPGISRSNIVLWVKNSLESGTSIKVVDDQFRTPTLVEDLAMGCYLIAKKTATGIYHISGEEMMSPYDIATTTARHLSLDQSLITRTDSTGFTQPARRPPKTGFIIEKAKQDLGFQPHTFIEGLDITMKNLRTI